MNRNSIKNYSQTEIFMHMQSLGEKTIHDITQRLVKTYNPQKNYLLEPQRDNNVDINILVVIDHAGLQQRYAMMAEGHKVLIYDLVIHRI
jgi:hypothetical protein